MNLARIQEEFLDAVLGAAPPRDAGLAIYHRNALEARREALAAVHPVTRRLVGEAFFDEAAARFARAHPSSSGDLHAYGRELAGFLAAYPPAGGLPYLPDVARLEWAVHECLHAADGAPLDHAALGAIEPSELSHVCLRLHPAVRWLESPYPILAIWEANQPARDGTPERQEGAERVLVRRVGLAVVPVLVDAAAWTLLHSFARGAALGEACAALGRDEEFPGALMRLAGWGAIGGHALGAP